MIVGLIGGASDTRQQFHRTSEQELITNYVVDFTGQPGWPRNNGPTFSYPLPTDHLIDSVQKQTLIGPTLGATLSFFRGGFFYDGAVKADFLNLNRTSDVSDLYARTLTANFILPGGTDVGCIKNDKGLFPTHIPPPFYRLTNPLATITETTQETSAINLIVAENLGYHFDLPYDNWIEPLIGVRYTFSTYGSNAASLGLEDGNAVRVHGGARFGFTRFTPDRYIWTTSFTALLYSDVWIQGFVTNADGFSAGALLADEGKLRVLGALTSKVDLLNGISAFAEVQARYGQDYWGIGGRIGARYEW
jgi:hypothetical protein